MVKTDFHDLQSKQDEQSECFFCVSQSSSCST